MTIEDTSKRDAARHLIGGLAEGSEGYITGMEAAGQQQVVNSTKIPTDGPADQLEALGFTLGLVDESDPMFRDCQLPEGWKREGSDHSMWSYIVDAEGQRRVAIFYKAAFYDRSAHFYVTEPAEQMAKVPPLIEGPTLQVREVGDWANAEPALSEAPAEPSSTPSRGLFNDSPGAR